MLIQYLNGTQILHTVNFLFSKTIVSRQGKCVYRLYEFKLAPGQYHAELVSPIDPKAITRIKFKKENGKWQTSLRSKEAKRLAEIFGNAIDKAGN
jgi:hypothetical protein